MKLFVGRHHRFRCLRRKCIVAGQTATAEYWAPTGQNVASHPWVSPTRRSRAAPQTTWLAGSVVAVIEEGAYADLLLVDGNPLDDITVIGANPEWYDAEPRNDNIPTIPFIMKGGKELKNTLQAI
jgi:hypothetical protein